MEVCLESLSHRPQVKCKIEFYFLIFCYKKEMKHLNIFVFFLVNPPYPFSKDLVCEAGKIGSASQKLENSEMIKTRSSIIPYQLEIENNINNK